MDRFTMETWLSMSASETNSDYTILRRIIDLSSEMEDSLNNEGIFLNDNFEVCLIRFCYFLSKHSSVKNRFKNY